MSTNPHVPPFPPVDARLIEPESGFEVVRGEVVMTAAKFPHARPQARLVALLEVHVGDDWVVATELTSRVAEDSDFTADASIRPRLADPRQHDHIIDEIAFEVVNTQRPKVALAKAEDLVARGVRRVFVIDVPMQRVVEWTRSEPLELGLDTSIVDRTLARPLPVRALVGLDSVKSELAEALLATPPPVLRAALEARLDRGTKEGRARGLEEGRARGLEEGRARGLEEGRARGIEEGRAQGVEEGHALAHERMTQRLRQQVFDRLDARGLAISDATRASLNSPASVEAWIERVVRAETVARSEDLFEGQG